MTDHWVLKHIDGNFQIVLPPSVLDSNYQFHSRYIRIHHEVLRTAIAGREVWPPERVAAELYSSFKVYFQKLGGLFDPVINTDILDPIDRHLFFICTEPIELPQYQNLVPGLSGLEQLMGYKYADPSAPPSPEPEYTTGNSELDILVDTLLIFKRNGYKLAQMMGLNDLSKCCVQANNRMRIKEDDSEPEEAQSWKEDPEFTDRRSEIEDALRASGIESPV